MRVTVPRSLIFGLAAVFSAYLLVIASASLSVVSDTRTDIAAMVVFAIATALSLTVSRRRMPSWLALVNVGAAIAIPLLVTGQSRHGGVDDYPSWHIAAVGTLMVITSIRRCQPYAWIGTAFLVIETAVLLGPAGLIAPALIGSVAWVLVSFVLLRALGKAARDTRQYALAEREAVEWRAAQEAHVSERQFRIAQTSRMALPILQEIVSVRSNLSDGQRRECLYLEGAIRDEIRGRTLLNDRVRHEVMAARRRGTSVMLLDEGGIDDLDENRLEWVRSQIADAIHDTVTEKFIVRTVSDDSAVAVTVVGLSSAPRGELFPGAAGGEEWQEIAEEEPDEDDDVDLWLEIPRA